MTIKPRRTSSVLRNDVGSAVILLSRFPTISNQYWKLKPVDDNKFYVTQNIVCGSVKGHDNHFNAHAPRIFAEWSRKWAHTKWKNGESPSRHAFAVYFSQLDEDKWMDENGNGCYNRSITNGLVEMAHHVWCVDAQATSKTRCNAQGVRYGSWVINYN